MAPTLDNTDLRILHALQTDPRLPISKVARLVGLTDNAVRYRLRRLQQLGVFRGFHVQLDPGLLGRPRLGLLLVRLADPAALSALMDGRPEYVAAYRTAGPWHGCLLACLRDSADLDRAAGELRRSPGVEDVLPLLVLDGLRGAPMPLLPEPPGIHRDVRGPPPASP